MTTAVSRFPFRELPSNIFFPRHLWRFQKNKPVWTISVRGRPCVVGHSSGAPRKRPLLLRVRHRRRLAHTTRSVRARTTRSQSKTRLVAGIFRQARDANIEPTPPGGHRLPVGPAVVNACRTSFRISHHRHIGFHSSPVKNGLWARRNRGTTKTNDEISGPSRSTVRASRTADLPADDGLERNTVVFVLCPKPQSPSQNVFARPTPPATALGVGCPERRPPTFHRDRLDLPTGSVSLARNTNNVFPWNAH